MNKERKEALLAKVQQYGLSDLRKLAPIGDLWYMNGWEEGGIEWQIYHAFYEQGFHVDRGWDTGWAGTDHHHHCSELGLTWHVDSSD